ncbi:Nuclear receptor ROR-beta, partial [Caligus rogercresseyi]
PKLKSFPVKSVGTNPRVFIMASSPVRDAKASSVALRALSSTTSVPVKRTAPLTASIEIAASSAVYKKCWPWGCHET